MRTVTRAAWPSSTLPLCQTVVLLALAAAAAHAQSAGIGLSSVRAQAFFNQDFDGFPLEANDRFAAALAVGDFNGDGAEDLATGMPYDNGPWDLPLQDAGAVVVRWGVPGAGLSPAAPTLLSLYSSGLTQAHAGDHYGHALAAGDFDGDGRDDLAVGIPYLITYFSGNDPDLGAVQIHYGLPGGIQLAGQSLFTSSPNGNTFDPPRLGDYFGYSLAAGDFDGDGYDDLAIGAPQSFEALGAGEGAVIVLHGGPSGLAAFPGYMITQDDPLIPDDGENLDDFGWALAAGNFNGDGRCIGGICRDIEDLAISAPGEDDVGAVMVILGSDYGLVFLNSFYFGEANFGGVGEANDQFGASLAVGNFDGDFWCPPGVYCFRLDDLAIGTPFEDLGAVNQHVNAGEVTVLFGGGASFFDLAKTRHLSQSTLVGFDETGDAFGLGLAAGDFDSDLRDDLAVGQPGENGGEGGATILMGGIGGFDGRRRFVSAGFDGVPPGPQSGADMGFALAAGDFDGDRHFDLAIGTPRRSQSGLDAAGAETILYGSLFADGFDSGNSLFWSASVP